MADLPINPLPITLTTLPEPEPGATLTDYVRSLAGAHTRFDPATNATDAEAAANASLGPRLEEIRRDWRAARRALDGVTPRWFSMTQIGVGTAAEIVGCWRLFEELGTPRWPALVMGTMVAVGLVTLAMLVSRAAQTTRKGFWAAVGLLGIVAISIGFLRVGELNGDDDESRASALARFVLVVAATLGPPLLIESASRSLREHGAAFDHAADLKKEHDEVGARLENGQRYIRVRVEGDQRHAERVEHLSHAARASFPLHFPAASMAEKENHHDE